ATASPEARHLIFALPFFSTLLAAPIVAVALARPPATALLGVAAVAVVLFGEVRWAERKTPPLFHGDPPARAQAREQAAAWLVRRSRSNDVLFGYEPVYLAAWDSDHSLTRLAVPRADPKLLADALRSIPRPLGHGVWVFDADDSTNVWRRPTIAYTVPKPARSFEARPFGPYLVIRSRSALTTPSRF